MLLNLNSQESQRLHKLSQDKATVEALKKLFLNQFIKDDPNLTQSEINASYYLAIHALDDCFIALNNLQPVEGVNKIVNMV